jgi:anti-sigma factor RsiW
MADAKNDRQRFSRLLPFYVNSTLNAQDHDWMTRYLAAHPEAARELDFVSMLRKTTRSMASKMPESERLERLMREWKSSRPTASRLQKAMQWLQGRVRIPAPAMVLASVVMLGQAVVIGSLVSEPSETSLFRSERPECVAAPTLRVLFRPDARHADILLILRSVEATVQNGPSETGALWLTVPPGRSLDEAQAMLRSSALVEEVVPSQERQLPAGCAR